MQVKMVSSSSTSSRVSKRELRSRRILIKRSTKKLKKNRENASFNVHAHVRKPEKDMTEFNHDMIDVNQLKPVDDQLNNDQLNNDAQQNQENQDDMNYMNMDMEDMDLDYPRQNEEIPILPNVANNDHAEEGTIDYVLKEKEKKDSKRYNDLKKDVAAMNARIDPLIKEWQQIKSIIKRRGFVGPEVTDDDEDEEYDELPRLPLRKIKHILLMEDNIDNRAYKKQLIAKLRSIGGSNIKKNVINIFNKLFTLKLRKKICWKGSLKGGKAAFENFENILSVLRQAVKYRHKKCSAADIETECKLRFKQAEKDYERAMLKLQQQQQQQ